MKIEAKLPFHSEMPETLQAKARRVLRFQINDNPQWAKSNLEADCILEQVWNAFVGHDKIKPDDR